MNPHLDEIIVATLLRTAPEFLQINLQLHASHEAYGPSRNEGLCYESCYAIGFSGDLRGQVYFCMDGYTRLKLLPRVAKRFSVDVSDREMADSVLLEFSNQMAARFVAELGDGGFSVSLEPPEDLSHKLVSIDLERNRQYILILFIRDRREHVYLGRLYFVLTLQKY